MLNFFCSIRMCVLAVSFALIGTATLTNSAAAQVQYPNKPITLVISTPPGSGSDIVGRKIAEGLSNELGVPVVVENKGGAAGLVAAAAVARASPDGYTLVWNAPAAITTWPHLKKLDFDPTKDLKPVAMAVRYPIVWLANSKLPVTSITELIALDKKLNSQGKRLTTGNAGVGGQNHLGTLMLNQLAGTNLLPIPYKGEAPSVTDLMGGQVDTVVTSLTSVMPHLESGKLTLLASGGSERARLLPDLPTLAELGFPEYSIEGWGGVFVPAATSEEIVGVLSAAIIKIVKSPEMAKFMQRNGSEPVGIGPEEFTQVILRESLRNKKLVEQFDVVGN